jgi:hypothetical protein
LISALAAVRLRKGGGGCRRRSNSFAFGGAVFGLGPRRRFMEKNNE